MGVLRSMGRVTVHSDIQDCHLYIMKKWVCDYVMHDKNISAIKGELLPILVSKQFSKVKSRTENLNLDNVKKTILDFLPENKNITQSADKKTSYVCSAYLSSLPCLRVNTVPVYWEVNKRARGTMLHPQVREILLTLIHFSFHNQAKIGERAQLTDCKVGMNCTVSDKTTLTGVCLGSGSRVEEKVRLSNCVVMENVVIETGSNIEDSIICDNCIISGKSNIKLSIMGRGQQTGEGAELVSQLVLDKDRMMEV